jgi:hypothetical protein
MESSILDQIWNLDLEESKQSIDVINGNKYDDIRLNRCELIRYYAPDFKNRESPIFLKIVSLVYDLDTCLIIFDNYDYIIGLIDNLNSTFADDAFMLMCKVANDEGSIDIKSIVFTESSGASFVYLEGDFAYQIYKDEGIVAICVEIQSRLFNKPTIPFIIDEERNITSEISSLNNIVPLISYNTELKYTKWLRFTPLQNIINNIHKLIWDIGKAIYSLHSIDCYHGDSVLDNVGERDGRFILFDFNGSKFRGAGIDHRTLIAKDYNLFFNSLIFNGGPDLSMLPKNDSFLTKFLLLVAEQARITPSEAYQRLENLEIQRL